MRPASLATVAIAARWPCVVILVAISILWPLERLARLSAAQQMISVLSEVRREQLEPLSPHDRELRLKLAAQSSEGRDVVALLDPNGRWIAGDPLTHKGSRLFSGRVAVTGHDLLLPDGQRLFVGEKADPASDHASLALLTVSALAVLGLAAMGLWALERRRRLALRLRRIGEICDAVGQGRFSVELPISPEGDLLDSMSGQVNGMIGRLSRLMGMLQEQSDHVRHEYGNSAGRMGVYLDQIRLSKTRLPPQVTEAIDALELERRHFLALTEAILNLWRARQGGQHMHDQELSVLADEAAEVLEMRAEAKRITLTTRLEPAAITGDAQMLMMLLSNLLGNALKYTPEDGSVEVVTEVHNDEVHLLVSDSGPGIPEDKREVVFETRHRLAQTEHIAGNGYGLAIAKAIVRLHGATIKVETSILGGACFHVRFPLALIAAR